MSDEQAIEVETRPVLRFPQRSHVGIAGRPMNPARARRMIELARAHGRRALVVAIRRLSRHLADPLTPVDANYLRAFAELAGRCGLPIQTSQSVDSTSVTSTLTSESVEELGRRLLAEVLEDERRVAAGDGP